MDVVLRMRNLVLIACVLSMLALSSNAEAKRKFCSRIHYTYQDDGLGEDHLLPSPGWQVGRGFWMVVKQDGNNVWGPDYILAQDGCTPAISTPAGNYVVETYSAIRSSSSSFIFVNFFADGAWHPQVTNLGFLAASSGSAVTNHNIDAGFGFTPTWGVFNVAAALSPLFNGADSFGLKPGTYKVLASTQCPGAISCYDPSTDVVMLGRDPDLWGWDFNSKFIIGHEFGHYVQSRLFGRPKDQTAYCHTVSGTEALCRCDHVSGPSDTVCSGTPVNQAHCLQSREDFSAALAEGWAHFYATALFNIRLETNAIFGYYKEFLGTVGGTAINPPVAHSPFYAPRWMESNCSSSLQGRGVEIDWQGFLYVVHSQTSNGYSFSNFESIFENSNVCNGTCDPSTDSVTWTKLTTAVTSLFSAAKRDYFINKGADYGVDH